MPDFRFDLIDTTYTENDLWFSQKRYDRTMKYELRQGGCDTLNIYSNSGVGFLGFATFPDECDNYEDHANDGVVIDFNTLPGGAVNS